MGQSRNYSRGHPVIQLNLNGDELARFDSISLAAKSTRTNLSGIYACLYGSQHTAGGFCWRFDAARKRELIAVRKPSGYQKKPPNERLYRYRPVIQLDPDDGHEIARFASIAEAAAQHRISPNGISSCARGRARTAAGYAWKYAETVNT